MSKRREHSPEFKGEVAELSHAAGAGQLAEELGISAHILSRWR